MRRIGLWLVSTVVVVVLLFTYRTSTSGPGAALTAPVAQAPGIVTSGTGVATAPATAPSASAVPSATSGSATTVVNGSVAQTRWGPVQVQVDLSGRRIVDVSAIVYPSGSGRDREINSSALPQLRSEVLAAQSADIDGVSGATVTSDGYRESLQAALSAAHFGQ